MPVDLTDFQRRVMVVPEEHDIFLGGGRGGGKSYALGLLALRYANDHGERARILYLRKTYKGLTDFEMVTRELFGAAYGSAARFNAAEHVWRLPNGAYMELGQLESAADYSKYQGRSFGLLLADEVGQYATPDLLDMMRSNLRGAAGVPVRVALAGNPGGPGHFWLAKRYVFTAAPWKPFFEPRSKRTWVYAPSTFDMNRFIDRAGYRDQLESACHDDPELLRAWTTGDWAVSRGAYFAPVCDEHRNAVEPWDKIPHGWRTWLAHDFGSSAPSVTYIVALSPGATVNGRFYPRDSMVLVDELATHKRDSLHVGLGWTVPTLAEEIHVMCRRWNIRAEGVADDSIFARTGSGAGSISDEFRRCSVYFNPAQKSDRISGWQKMRRLLADAGKPDVPGLYISRACSYWWSTVPYLARDEKRIEDVDSSGPDHGADATRYGILRVSRMPVLMPLNL